MLDATDESSDNDDKKEEEDKDSSDKTDKETIDKNNTVSSNSSTSTNTTVSGNSSVSNNQSGNTTTGDYYKVYIDNPEGVEVYVDGNYIGISPVNFKKVSGIHVVTLRKS